MIIIRRLLNKTLKMNNWLLFWTSAALVIFSSLIMVAIEPETYTSPFHAFWWVMTTVTTVGYGDVYPTTVVGRVYAIFLFVFGIGLIGVAIGKVVDGLGAYRKKREEGKLTYNGENHIVIIGWSRKAYFAVEEILDSHADIDVIIIDTLEKAPLLQERVHYVRGEASEEKTLLQANLTKARSALVFSDGKIDDPQLADGKTLLVVTTIERTAPGIHTTVEVMDEKHIKNFPRVDVDEFILTHEMVSRLAVRSAFMSGVSAVYTQLMSRRHGDNLYKIKKRPHWKSYRDAFEGLLEEGATLVSDRENLSINRALDDPIPDDAQLYVICDAATFSKFPAQI
jgi:voltage-gated potassium channel